MKVVNVCLVVLVCVMLYMSQVDARSRDNGNRRRNLERKERPQDVPEGELDTEMVEQDPTLPPRTDTAPEDMPLRKPKGSRGERRERPEGGRREGRPERPGRPMKPGKGEKPKKHDCGDYLRGAFSACNTTTEMRTLTLTILDESLTSENCRASKVVSVPCERGCKYEYNEMSPCDPETNTKTLVGTLLRTEETPADCEDEHTRTKPCHMGKPGKGPRREKPGKVGRGKRECGDYVISSLSMCNDTSLTRVRTYTPLELVEGCPESKMISVNCEKDCKYDYTVIPECDPETNVKTIRGTLIITEHTPSDCPPEQHKEKPCSTEGRPNKGPRRERPGRHGEQDVEAECEFGEWGEYSECVDGEKTRTREVLNGKRKCRRHTEETVECS